METYKITILSNGAHASITRKCADLKEAMAYSAMLAKRHFVEHYAARFIDNMQGESVAVYNPTVQGWKIIEH